MKLATSTCVKFHSIEIFSGYIIILLLFSCVQLDLLVCDNNNYLGHAFYVMKIECICVIVTGLTLAVILRSCGRLLRPIDLDSFSKRCMVLY